ncbi:MAG: ABC transporter permease, partial [Chromatiales bacterium]
MREILFIAWHDAKHQLRQGSTLVWVFLMPPIFFYFIGTMTSGFSSGMSAQDTPLLIIAESPGFLQEQIDVRLRDNDFAPEWVEELLVAEGVAAPPRTLTLSPNLTDKIVVKEQVTAVFETKASALTREFELIRVRRGMYTALADIIVANVGSDAALTAADMIVLNEKPRNFQLDVSPAGKRKKIPSGFEQAIPGILVMFTILVVLTSGGSMLVNERKQGLLRRLASAPFSRFEVISGNWGGRLLIASVQMSAALLVGTYVFKMAWGPDFGMVLVVLAAWAG